MSKLQFKQRVTAFLIDNSTEYIDYQDEMTDM